MHPFIPDVCMPMATAPIWRCLLALLIFLARILRLAPFGRPYADGRTEIVVE